MKKAIWVFIAIIGIAFMMGCKDEAKSDEVQAQQTEQLAQEANRKVGMPAIVNFQEKKNLKWIYELCDDADFICYAYLFNSIEGKVGQYLGECIGYGIPYSTQFSNPEKVVKIYTASSERISMPQSEPNGLFKPEGLSATWLIMVDPVTKQPKPVYVEPEIIVSPFKLH